MRSWILDSGGHFSSVIDANNSKTELNSCADEFATLKSVIIVIPGTKTRVTMEYKRHVIAIIGKI